MRMHAQAQTSTESSCYVDMRFSTAVNIYRRLLRPCSSSWQAAAPTQSLHDLARGCSELVGCGPVGRTYPRPIGLSCPRPQRNHSWQQPRTTEYCRYVFIKPWCPSLSTCLLDFSYDRILAAVSSCAGKEASLSSRPLQNWSSPYQLLCLSNASSHVWAGKQLPQSADPLSWDLCRLPC